MMVSYENSTTVLSIDFLSELILSLHSKNVGIKMAIHEQVRVDSIMGR